MAFWIAATFVLIILLYFAVVKPLNYWKYRNVPQYHFLITVREILLGFIPYRVLQGVPKLYNDFPDSRYVGFYQFAKPILGLRDPDLIKQITVKDFDHFVDHFQMFPEDTEPIWTKNLFALKGDRWREMRATLSPSFTSSKMKMIFTLISDYAKQFVAYFEEQNCGTISVEMKDISTRFTNDIIATSAFGINCDSMRNPNNEFFIMGKTLTNGFKGVLNNLKFLLIVALPKIAKIFGLKIFSTQITNFFTKLVKENIESREKIGIVRQDMIHLLMEARKGKSKYDKAIDSSLETGFTQIEGSMDEKEDKRLKNQLTDEDIVAQALIFFFAGFDSVSTLMSFLAHELAINVNVQERLQSEIDETLEECAGNLSYEALSKMKYMDMVIAETLRKWVTPPALDRVCTKPYTIQPVKKGEVPINLLHGDLVWVFACGLHKDPHTFPDPERFDPERFNEENKSKIPPYTYMSFGVGPRSCIGNRFALMETKLMFFYILRKFHLTVTEKTVIPLKLAKSNFQLTAKDGFWYGLKPRN